jgi:hypothetical protein
VTLPSPSTFANTAYYIKDNGAGTASVLPHSAETIDGHASISLSTAYEGIMVISNGTNWFIPTANSPSIL